jgi:hypothetical protein
MDQATVRAWCSLSVLPQSAPQVLRALAAMPEVEGGVGCERAV